MNSHCQQPIDKAARSLPFCAPRAAAWSERHPFRASVNGDEALLTKLRLHCGEQRPRGYLAANPIVCGKENRGYRLSNCARAPWWPKIVKSSALPATRFGARPLLSKLH
jgi:hypothetical protein